MELFRGEWVLLTHHWPVRVWCRFTFVRVLGGVKDRHSVRVMMTESKSQLIKIFMLTRHQDLTLICVERRMYSSQYRLLLSYPSLITGNATFCILSVGSFLNVKPFQSPRSLFQTLLITKIKVVTLNINFYPPFVFPCCVLVLLALGGALPAQYKIAGFPIAMVGIGIAPLSILGMAFAFQDPLNR